MKSSFRALDARCARVRFVLVTGVALLAAWLMAPSVAAQTVLHVPTSTAVAATSSVVHVPVAIVLPGALGSIQVLTQGVAQRDFRDAGTGTCALSLLGVGAACTVDVTFTPTSPGRRLGAVVLLGAGGQVLGSQLLDGMATGPLAVIQPGVISTDVGSGKWVYRGDGVAATAAQIFLPMGVVTAPTGDIYVSDSGNNRIRRVDATTSLISTYAGIGSAAASGDGGVATLAGLSNPAALALDGAGNLYVADSGNNAVRRIDAVTHVMTTVAGVLGLPGYSGDGLAAIVATLNGPTGIAFDADGSLYIADTYNHAIRRVDARTHVMTTIAGGHGAGATGDGGPATAATLNGPSYLAFGPDGLLYLADQANDAVRRIDGSGTMSTVAGTLGLRGYSGDGAAATKALLHGPAGIVFDPGGNLYVADSVNGRIRRVDATTKVIATIAGSDATTGNGDGSNDTLASLSGPTPLFMDGGGNLYVGDLFHNVVRLISANSATLQYPVMRVGKISAPSAETVDNDGNSALTLGASVLVQAQLDAATTTCTGTPMVAGATCQLGVAFAPTQVGDWVQGSGTLPSDAANSAITIWVAGQVLSVEPTTVALGSDTNPATPGQAVTLTATVSSADMGRTGTVTFLDGTTALATVTLSASGTATLSTTTLALGQHSLTAAYSGDANNASAISAVLLEKILQASQIVLQSSNNPSIVTQAVTFKATITGTSSAISSGTMTFVDGATTLGSGSILSDGSASVTVATLAAGAHAVTAQFAGNANSLAAQSNVLSQVVNLAGSTTLVAVSPATMNVGDTATLSATVASASGPLPTGSVTFRSGLVAMGTAVLDGSGTAVFRTAALLPGTDSITAVYAGDASNGGSTSSAISVVVNRLATTTALVTTGSPANAGSSLTLTANVALGGGLLADGALTGTVTFYDGTNTLGTVAVDGTGVASLATASLAVATHLLTASFSGSTNYAPSSSASVVQVVRQSVSTTALSVSAASVVAGKPVTLTASVTTAGVAATGSVTFSDEDGTVGSAVLTGTGNAAVVVTTLPVGTHTIVATYTGDATYGTSKSAGAGLVVAKGQTLLTLLPSALSLSYGDTLTVTVTLTSDGVIAANTVVSVSDGSNALATVTLNSAGVGTYASATLAAGSHTLSASFAGDAGNGAAASAGVAVQVNQAKTVTALTTSATPSLVRQPVTLQAAVSSSAAGLTGTVTFQEGTIVLGAAPVSATGAAVLTMSSLSVGQHAIVAVYGGDAAHAGSTSAALSEAIVEGTTVMMTSSANPGVAGRSIQWTVQVAAADSTATTAQPSGSVTFNDGATVLSTVPVAGGGATLQSAKLAVGVHALTATYSGDMVFQAATSPVLAQTITSATTQAVLTLSASSATYGSAVSMHAMVTGLGGTPTGTVTFLDGATAAGTATLGADGSATLTTSSLLPGMHALLVSYSGDAGDAAAVSAAVQLQVLQTTQTVVAMDVNPALTLQPVTVTATVHHAAGTPTGAAATGAVIFSDGATQVATVSLDATGVATLPAQSFAAGTHSITAVYGGDTADFSSTSAAVALNVQLRPTTDALTATATSSTGVLTLVSVLQWSGPVVPTGTTVFMAGTSVLGSSHLDAVGVATLNVTASTLPQQVTAVYSGDAVYAASTSPAANVGSVSGQATTFSLTVNPASISIPTKKYAVATVTLQSSGGFADTLSIGCLGLPVAATCTFDKDTVTLAANGTVSVTVTIDTGSPLTAGGDVSSVRNDGARAVMLGGLPLGALLGWMLLGRGRRRYGALLLVLLGMLLPMMGCGTLTTTSTPVGSYTIKVTAAGLNSNVTATQSVAVTVTQ